MLSKKAQYALKALGYLAEQKNNTPVLITTIAKEKHIPLKFLENILLQLNKAEILCSKKGKGGGYFLVQDPKTISVAKIIRIIDGPIALLPCVSLYFYERCQDCNEKVCRLNKVLIEARDAILGVLENKMLQDIV
ncbi:MAG: Rrf2 family transcriptional regulator [Ginsengibacter sp.]